MADLAKPKFDPSKPFEVAQLDKPKFDPSKPLDKPKFDPSKPFEEPQSTQPEEEGMLKRYARGALKTLPFAGGLIGGAVGNIPGAGLGAFAGTAAKNIGERFLDPEPIRMEAPTMGGIAQSIQEPAQEAAWSMLGQGVAGPIARGIGKLGQAVKTGAKEAAPLISSAAERLGIKTTPGLLSNSPVVQGLESSLEQSPTLAGSYVREQTAPMRKGLQQSAEGLLAERAGTKVSAGREVSKGISAKLGEKYSNIQMAYEPFNKELPKMFPDFESKAKLADDIAKATKGNLSISTNIEGYGEKVANSVVNSKSLDDLENVRKQMGNSLDAAYSSGDRNAIDSLSKIYDHLSDFRDNQFVTLAKQNYPAGGSKIGTDMVKEYENARSIYKSMMDDLKEVGPALGIKNKNPKAFMDAIQKMPPEKLSQTMFKSNNIEAVEKLQKYFPEEFDKVRQLKLQEIYTKSLTPEGDLSPKKLLNNVKNIEPEYQKIIFGKKAQTLEDIKIIAQNYPAMIGPSGTPQGEQYKSLLNPIMQATELGRYGAYKTLASPLANQKVSGLLERAAQPDITALTGQGLLKPAIRQGSQTGYQIIGGGNGR